MLSKCIVALLQDSILVHYQISYRALANANFPDGLKILVSVLGFSASWLLLKPGLWLCKNG